MSHDEDRAELESWLGFVAHEGWRDLVALMEYMQDRATEEVMNGRVADDTERSIRVGTYRACDQIIAYPANRMKELRAALNLEGDE